MRYNWKQVKEGYSENVIVELEITVIIAIIGATPLLRIDNPNSSTNKELIIFRDSYGSSLTPLLVEGYKKIIVVDTRYISPKILDQYIEFTNQNQDVIFEYSTSLINDSIKIK